MSFSKGVGVVLESIQPFFFPLLMWRKYSDDWKQLIDTQRGIKPTKCTQWKLFWNDLINSYWKEATIFFWLFCWERRFLRVERVILFGRVSFHWLYGQLQKFSTLMIGQPISIVSCKNFSVCVLAVSQWMG